MPKLIYIIEDDDFFYSLVEEILKEFDVNLTRFKSFRQLVNQKNKIGKPDLAIVDYFLVDNFSKTENGILATEFLKKKFPEIKIIVLSAQIIPEITYDFIFKYRVNVYIEKDKAALIKLKSEIQKLLF
ncbi:MAG: response regulator [Bacteroidales bacterium]|nr:response regulator [Bacteroidales bacterium]